MTTTIQLKRGISTDWTTNNPVLAAGEVGIETDTNKMKIGDGSTAWTSLAYFSGNSGSGTTNYNELSNQPQINSVTLTGNKTSSDLHLMSDANFLPDGYTITLKADGTGDFATIQDAINFLNGKWSNGTVIIHLNAGTYSISTQINIGDTTNTLKFNIPTLIIEGDTYSNTIVNKTTQTNYESCLRIYSGKIKIQNISFMYNSKVSNTYGIYVEGYSEVYLNSVGIQNAEFGLHVVRNATPVIVGAVYITNTAFAIYAAEGGKVNTIRATITINNSTYALRVWCGGSIYIGRSTKAFTSVTNVTSQTIGNIGADGFIIGSWSN